MKKEKDSIFIKKVFFFCLYCKTIRNIIKILRNTLTLLILKILAYTEHIRFLISALQVFILLNSKLTFTENH